MLVIRKQEEHTWAEISDMLYELAEIIEVEQHEGHDD